MRTTDQGAMRGRGREMRPPPTSKHVLAELLVAKLATPTSATGRLSVFQLAPVHPSQYIRKPLIKDDQKKNDFRAVENSLGDKIVLQFSFVIDVFFVTGSIILSQNER